MNRSKIDKNNPVLMAIMIKCKKVRQSGMADHNTLKHALKEYEHDADHHGKSKEPQDQHIHH